MIQNDRDWDLWLDLASHAYNTSVHEGTRYTPHELVFGRIAANPNVETPPDDVTCETYNQYLRNLYERITNVQELARENLIGAKEKSKERYDKRMRPQIIEVDDKVYTLKEPRKNKLADQYVGPFEVVAIRENNNIIVKLRDNRMKTIHMDKVKKAG